jgi:hypothetical protein
MHPSKRRAPCASTDVERAGIRSTTAGELRYRRLGQVRNPFSLGLCVGGHLDLPSDGHEATAMAITKRDQVRWSVPNCAVGVATAYLNTQSGTQPDRHADRRVRARLRRGRQPQEVIALSATGQLGTATTGQIQLTVVTYVPVPAETEHRVQVRRYPDSGRWERATCHRREIAERGSGRHRDLAGANRLEASPSEGSGWALGISLRRRWR